jgi:hypothetical protein
MEIFDAQFEREARGARQSEPISLGGGVGALARDDGREVEAQGGNKIRRDRSGLRADRSGGCRSPLYSAPPGRRYAVECSRDGPPRRSHHYA